MPDTKLTLANLRTHLRKWTIVYAVMIGAALLLADLLWTATTPQIPDERQVLIYLAAAHSNAAPLADLAGDMLEKTREDFPDVASVEFQSLPFPDSAGDFTGPMLLMSRLATGEADAFLADSNAMTTLTQSGACLPLDDLMASGWLSGVGLEPYYTTAEDPVTGEAIETLSALRLDGLNALQKREAFDNRGAFLVIAASGRNTESTLRAVSAMVEHLSREEDNHD